MKIKRNDLIDFLDAQPVGTAFGQNNEVHFSEVTCDSRAVTKQSIFVAVPGASNDGHDYLAAAYAKTNLIVLEKEQKLPDNFHGLALKVKSSKLALAQLCKFVYSPQIQELTFFGVTGTNGKTSVTYILESLLEHLNVSTGVLGTNNHRLQSKVWDSELTTPGPVVLHKRLQEMQNLGAKAIAMEVSSHALDQARVDGLFFDVAIFTNLSLDHLDYHKTWEHYFASKLKLFEQRLGKDAISVVNGDDDYALKIKPCSGKLYTYGQNENNDFIFKVKHQSFAGSQAVLFYQNKEYSFFIPLVGIHNIYNTVAAIVAIWSQGFHLQDVIEGVKHISPIPGRLESLVNKQGINVLVDYAHTSDALNQVLVLLNQVKHQLSSLSRVVTVFGCGGDRDKSKRPLMFKVAQEHSDIVIVTTDNPRTESPEQIILDILNGEQENKKNIFVIKDRKQALQKAVSLCHEHDILLVAGKGHEDYQIIGDKKHAFSDHKILKEALNGN